MITRNNIVRVSKDSSTKLTKLNAAKKIAKLKKKRGVKATGNCFTLRELKIERYIQRQLNKSY